jgi:hypothetical protein
MLKKNVVFKGALLFITCVLLLSACGTAGTAVITSPPPESPSPSVSSDPLADIKSEDALVCAKGVHLLIEDTGSSNYAGMLSEIRDGSVNSEAVIDELEKLAVPGSEDPLNISAAYALIDLCYGSAGEAAKSKTLKAEGTADAILGYLKKREIDGRIVRLFASNSFPSNVKVIDYMIENRDLYGANVKLFDYKIDDEKDMYYYINPFQTYFQKVSDPVCTYELLKYYMAGDSPTREYLYAQIIQFLKFDEGAANFFKDAFSQLGTGNDLGQYITDADKMIVELIGKSSDEIYILPDNIRAIAELVPGFEKKVKDSRSYDFGTEGLDGSKALVIEISNRTNEKNIYYGISPYSFTAVPKESVVSVKSMYGAGVIVSVHIIYKFIDYYYTKSYKYAVPVYRTDVQIMKLDLISGTVTRGATLKGDKPPAKFTLESGKQEYIEKGASDLEIAQAVKDILMQ